MTESRLKVAILGVGVIGDDVNEYGCFSFSTLKIEILFPYYETCPFKEYNSAVFHKDMKLCNHHHSFNSRNIWGASFGVMKWFRIK